MSTINTLLFTCAHVQLPLPSLFCSLFPFYTNEA